MTETEAAWLAGLLEGEGSFLLASPSCYSAAVGISLQMADEDVVARAATLLGATYRKWISPRNATWKPVFIVNIRGRRAVAIMNAVLPYMGKRRTERIQQALASIQHRPRYQPQYVLTDEMRVFATREHATGRSGRSIARELGKHHSVVCRFLSGKYGE